MASASAKTYSIRLGNIAKDVRIISIKVDISPGRLVSLSGMPAGWSFSINNDPAGQVEITGGGAIGAAMIYPDELIKMRFQIENDESNESIRCKGEIQSTVDFTSVKTTTFGLPACVVESKP
jgi:hypothetical protein